MALSGFRALRTLGVWLIFVTDHRVDFTGQRCEVFFLRQFEQLPAIPGAAHAYPGSRAILVITTIAALAFARWTLTLVVVFTGDRRQPIELEYISPAAFHRLCCFHWVLPLVLL
ncbi:hypothetical protein D3C77_631260 [compost metagenome]